ncbi:MAG TPA: VWA domain-containing protein [Candidatus Polarisedimenticolaceae bacterium]|nr:VWA domain-containing protein [Candidatus Polarisedimenticolaceae bacterium]
MIRRRARPAAIALLLLVTSQLAVPAQDSERRRGFDVTILEPVMQEVVFGKTKIAAGVEIDDPDLVDRVEFLIGEEIVFVDREAPYEFFYDFGEEQRSWVVRVVAWHKEGVSVSDVTITRKLSFSNIESVNRVILWVSAQDRDGNFVTDLNRGDFQIYEDGAEQKIIDFYAENRAITLAIVIDTSGSMRDKIREVHEAAGAFVDTVREIDQAMVIDFDDSVFLIQDLTNDRDALREAITSTEPIGATSLYDAVHATYRKIGKVDGRKATILLSDGEDTSSQFGYKRVLQEAKSNNMLLYTIGIEGGGIDKSVLREFADNTGGRAYFVTKASELGQVYQRIAEELGKQYYLTYSTSNENWDGHWIKIDVESRRPGVTIRARKGYFAVRGVDRAGG